MVHSEFMDLEEAEYDSIMDINAKGTFFMSQAVSKFMIEKNVKGHILNVTSSSALRPAWTPYQMSKWAVRGFTLGLADTLYNATNPSGRYAVPEEIASLATFMVSSMGDMIVGDTFYMTGGSGTIRLHD